MGQLITLDTKRILLHRVRKRLKRLEGEDPNFIEGVIAGTLSEQGISLSDPLSQEIIDTILNKLNKG